MRIQQMLFAAFACSVLLIGCSKPIDAMAYDQTTIVEHDHDVNTSVNIPVLADYSNSILNNDSNFSSNTFTNNPMDFLTYSAEDLTQDFSLGSVFQGFKLYVLNGNYYVSLNKVIQTFHREEEIKINGELTQLNR